MARAKRTDRAAARRRNRALLANEPGDLEEEGLEASAAGTPRQGAMPSGRPAPAAPGGRPQGGIGYAFRAAFRPAHVREDLAHLPEILRQRSFWLTCLVIVGVALAYSVFRGRELISSLLLQYFLYPPPVGAIFITGFFARRASYLAGGLVGFVSAVVYSALVIASASGALPSPGGPTTESPVRLADGGGDAIAKRGGRFAAVSVGPSAVTSGSPIPAASPGPSPESSPTASAPPLTPEELDQVVREQVSAALTVSTISGILFGSAAAWYKRFLDLAYPNRGARRPPPKGKPRR